ncbi:MAG: hypothetical protein ABIU29_09455 [Chthoniobacterales bacterium]
MRSNYLSNTETFRAEMKTVRSIRPVCAVQLKMSQLVLSLYCGRH